MLYNEVFIFVQYVSWKSMIAPMTAYIATHAYDRGSTFAVQDLRKSPKKRSSGSAKLAHSHYISSSLTK